MRKFLRPKRVANEIASGENLTSASQPSESKPDTQPNESEARGSAADHASDSNVTKVAKRSSTVAEDANIEIMSCSSDAEVDDVETPDEDQPAAYEEALDKIKATEPEAVQWLRDDTHIDEDAQLRVTHLRNQARKIIRLTSSLNTQKKQRSGIGKALGLAKSLIEHNVAENKKTLQEKQGKSLRHATRQQQGMRPMLIPCS